MPNQEEQFEFFTNSNWPKEEDAEEAADKAKEKKVETKDEAAISKEEEEEKEDETKVTDKTPLIMNLDEDWREISYIKAVYIPHQLEKQNNGKLLFMPKASNSTVEI